LGLFSFWFLETIDNLAKHIISVISKRDTIAQAQSGTGKTTTFSIGLLQRINPKNS
jgi:ATP-dependent RNA helicase